MPLNFIYLPIGLVILGLVGYQLALVFKNLKKGGSSSKKAKISLYAFLVSLLFIVYYIFVVGTYYVLNSSESHETVYFEGSKIIYYLMTVPAFVLYIIYMFTNFKKIKYLCTITYPLIIINIYVAIMTIMAAEQFSGWFILLTILIPLILGVIAFSIGLIKDIFYLKNKKMN